MATFLEKNKKCMWYLKKYFQREKSFLQDLSLEIGQLIKNFSKDTEGSVLDDE